MSSSSARQPRSKGSVSQAEQRITRRRFTGLAGATLAAGLVVGHDTGYRVRSATARAARSSG